MRVIEVEYPIYILEHKGILIEVRASRLDSGRLVFDPIMGWDALGQTFNQDTESLLEDMDDAIYNATPEFFEE